MLLLINPYEEPRNGVTGGSLAKHILWKLLVCQGLEYNKIDSGIKL